MLKVLVRYLIVVKMVARNGCTDDVQPVIAQNEKGILQQVCSTGASSVWQLLKIQAIDSSLHVKDNQTAYTISASSLQAIHSAS